MNNPNPDNQAKDSQNRVSYSLPVLIIMVDVALLLAILFMCSARFKSLSGKFDIPLPTEHRHYSVPGDYGCWDKMYINVRHNKDNPLKSYLSIGLLPIADFEVLYQTINDIRNALVAENSEILPFVIDAEPEVPTQVVVNVINACKKAGINRIEFAAHGLVNSEPPRREKVRIAPLQDEDAVLGGLIWLARHQNPNGSWGAKTFTNQCKGTVCTGTGDKEFDVALTGLALLSYTSAGYTLSSGDVYEGYDFGEVVRKAVCYLMSIQDNQGRYGGLKQGKFMYNQAIAAYAMCDLYYTCKDSPIEVIFKDTAQKGIDYLISAKNPGQGWRYQPNDGQSDSSVTGWATMVLKSAEQAGLTVSPTIFAEIKSFYDNVTDKNSGEVGYTEPASQSVCNIGVPKIIHQPTLTAVGIMVRLFIDKNPSDPVNQKGVELIMKSLPVWDTSKEGIIDYCYWFFGSYCMMLYDGPDGPWWRKWSEKLKDVLLKNQRLKADGCACGSWDPIDRWGEEGGRVYATAINVLTLEVYYRLGITRLGSPR